MSTHIKGRYFEVGVENWFFMVSCLIGLNIVLGTWKDQSYGNFITISEFFESFLTFLQQNYAVLVILVLSGFIQINLCLVIEKLLMKDAISEGTGQAFYLINGASLPNLFIMYCFCSQIGIVPAFFIMAILVHMFCLKIFSYMYVNIKLRREWLNNKEKNGKDLKVSYPESINWKKLYLFMYLSPSLVYKPNDNTQWKLNICYILPALIKGILLFYVCFNIGNVFVVKELQKSASYINNGEFFELIKTAVRITIPVNIVWLLMFYYFTFCVFFDTWSKTVGYPLNQGNDWWNSETISTFWSKWNVIVHEWLKEMLYKPLLTAGINKTAASTIVFAFSAILHSYCFEYPFKLFNGFGFFAMVMQIPFQEYSNYVLKKYGPKSSNRCVWMQLMIGHTTGLILTYFNFVCYQNNYMKFSSQ